MHICKRTNIRETDPEAAKDKCARCNFCEREAIRQEFGNQARERNEYENIGCTKKSYRLE
jgi:hypothetical protein